ncbi:hypothetical protein B296_00029892 [Ensete ventricosum]|uniref:CCT domain-containing protein n=1 Tax=Ensete ventricosum TaxID=4639 RepID=A0A426ZH28_ENSVE|nr:hypothetical protein B296_00029892 [Ensete ventricosum]
MEHSGAAAERDSNSKLTSLRRDSSSALVSGPPSHLCLDPPWSAHLGHGLVDPGLLLSLPRAPLKGSRASPSLSSSPSITMFHSFYCSSSAYGDSTFLPSVFCSAAVPHALLSDGNGCLPLFPSSSPPDTSSQSAYYLHRNSSILSLPIHHHFPDSHSPPPPPPLLPPSSSPSSSACDYSDFNVGPARRVLSTGDLQVTKISAFLSSWAVAGRVRRYSAEERKERIERYRSKRHQRNFHRKITVCIHQIVPPRVVALFTIFIDKCVVHVAFQYACRKTLADSRPRVKGRFARNGEPETEIEMEADTTAVNSFDCCGYDNYETNHGCSASGDTGGDWWSQLQAALATDDEGESCYDEDLLASFTDVFSMNTLS